MEVNNLTFIIYKFLLKYKWIDEGEYDAKFIYLKPDPKLDMDTSFKLALPISSKSKDFYSFMKCVLEFIQAIYINQTKELAKITLLNENLKRRYTKHWIRPEEESRIPKMSKFHVYIPRN